MTATVQKWGNSQGIRLPKVFLEGLNIHEGNEVEIFTQNDSIVIKSAAPQYKSIQALFAGYEGEYTPEEIDWGEPAGNEVW
ncbi:MAG: AbrB/MazE/SpoVT family DNA-binding domain-containing protein [Clostridiales bacterium]|nr:AbrB/MazE/SpoVT family DNA-binding domain-containing protein [Clostridiales bacterium]